MNNMTNEQRKDAGMHYWEKVQETVWVQSYDGEVETLRKLSQPVWVVFDCILKDNDGGWVVAKCLNEHDAEHVAYALASMTPKED